MSILVYVAIAVVVLIVALIAYVATRPDTFHVERTGVVNAPAEVPYSLVNELRQWSRWSPFDKFDSQMKKTFDGPPSGPGAVSGWNGNNKAGEGRITITETKPAELIVIKLEFFRPFKATNRATFQFVPSGNSTRVTWAMDGTNNFIMKAMHLCINMDHMLGKDFEEGLANLNKVSQAETQKVS